MVILLKSIYVLFAFLVFLVNFCIDEESRFLHPLIIAADIIFIVFSVLAIVYGFYSHLT